LKHRSHAAGRVGAALAARRTVAAKLGLIYAVDAATCARRARCQLGPRRPGGREGSREAFRRSSRAQGAGAPQSSRVHAAQVPHEARRLLGFAAIVVAIVCAGEDGRKSCVGGWCDGRRTVGTRRTPTAKSVIAGKRQIRETPFGMTTPVTIEISLPPSLILGGGSFVFSCLLKSQLMSSYLELISSTSSGHVHVYSYRLLYVCLKPRRGRGTGGRSTAAEAEGAAEMDAE
jgi:hypothetical protein